MSRSEKCLGCGASLEGADPRRRHCSQACRQRAFERRRGARVLLPADVTRSLRSVLPHNAKGLFEESRPPRVRLSRWNRLVHGKAVSLTLRELAQVVATYPGVGERLGIFRAADGMEELL